MRFKSQHTHMIQLCLEGGLAVHRVLHNKKSIILDGYWIERNTNTLTILNTKYGNAYPEYQG